MNELCWQMQKSLGYHSVAAYLLNGFIRKVHKFYPCSLTKTAPSYPNILVFQYLINVTLDLSYSVFAYSAT